MSLTPVKRVNAVQGCSKSQGVLFCASARSAACPSSVSEISGLEIILLAILRAIIG